MFVYFTRIRTRIFHPYTKPYQYILPVYECTARIRLNRIRRGSHQDIEALLETRGITNKVYFTRIRIFYPYTNPFILPVYEASPVYFTRIRMHYPYTTYQYTKRFVSGHRTAARDSRHHQQGASPVKAMSLARIRSLTYPYTNPYMLPVYEALPVYLTRIRMCYPYATYPFTKMIVSGHREKNRDPRHYQQGALLVYLARIQGLTSISYPYTKSDQYSLPV